MNNVIRLNRRFAETRRLIHHFKKNEIDEPAYYKRPLDPHALQLIKKFEVDIIYSSYLEANKKPLNLKKRVELWRDLKRKEYVGRLNEARTSEPSVLIEKLSPEAKEHLKPHEQNEEVSEWDGDQTETDEYKEKKRELAKSKLKILTELGLRRSVLDFEAKSFPDNWMEDYETYNENENAEMLAESHYGTPGKLNRVHHIKIMHFIFEFR